MGLRGGARAARQLRNDAAMLLGLAAALFAGSANGAAAGAVLFLAAVADDVGKLDRDNAGVVDRFGFYAFLALVVMPTRLVMGAFGIPSMDFFYSPSNSVGFKISQDGHWVMKNIRVLARRHPYGKHPREHLDLLVFDEKSPAPTEVGVLPDLARWVRLVLRLDPVTRMAFTGAHRASRVVVFLHGGGFVALESAVQFHQATPLCRALQTTVVSFTYPLMDFRAIASTLRALAWLRQELGCTSVALVGESAGSVLATVSAGLVANRKVLEQFALATDSPELNDLDLPEVKCVASWSGILDEHSWRGQGWLSFLLQHAMTSFVGNHPFADEELPPQFRSLHSMLPLLESFPDLLLCVGSRDELGLCSSNQTMLEAMQQRNFPCELYEMHGRGHGVFGPPMVTPSYKEAAMPATLRTAEFIGKHW